MPPVYVVCSKQAFFMAYVVALAHPDITEASKRKKRSPVSLMNHHRHTTLENSLMSIFLRGHTKRSFRE